MMMVVLELHLMDLVEVMIKRVIIKQLIIKVIILKLMPCSDFKVLKYYQVERLAFIFKV